MLTMYWKFPLQRWAFVLLGGIFVLIAIVFLVVAVNSMVQQQSYQAGRCTITSKQVRQDVSTNYNSGTGTRRRTGSTVVYAPHFEYTVQTADGHSYAASGYDGSDIYTSDYASQQAIVDSYKVGQTYSCWYNPSKPTQAVLVRNPNWLFLILSGVFLLVGGVFGTVGILVLQGRIKMGSYSWRRGVTLFS